MQGTVKRKHTTRLREQGAEVCNLLSQEERENE